MTDTQKRPLSPHLQVYRPQLTSVMSILHRITGAALSIGQFIVIWWLVALAAGPQAYATFQAFAGHPVGIGLLLCWSAALFYHLCNGVRHLLWDMGYCLTLKGAYRAGYVVLIVAALLTAATWICVLQYQL